MSCEQKEALLQADSAALRFYTFAAKQLAEARAAGSKRAYEDAMRIAEDARNQYEAGRRELEAHISAHGC